MRVLVAIGMLGLAEALVVSCGARVGGPEGRGPGVTFPAKFAEGEQDAGEPAPARDAGGGDGAEPTGPPRTGYAPDPDPLRVAEQWEYQLEHVDGRVEVRSVAAKRFRAPIVTARRMGRYAIELWIGRELIERVRFDFPLGAAESPRTSPRRPLHEPPTFAPGVRATVTLLVPASPRATRAILLDRATGASRPLPWPPDDPIDPPAGSSAEEKPAPRGH